VAIKLILVLLAHPGFHSVVATRDGKTVGSNFMDERSPIVGIGPASVDPSAQNRGVGRLLMGHVLAHAEGLSG
jgi:predicted N-acetyltransferase YhbS